MNLLETKILIILIFGVFSFLIGLATIPLKRCLGMQGVQAGARQVLTSVLLCFGGGVMLAVTMLHILPETGETLAETAEKIELECLPQLLICLGFFLIYTVEETVDFVLGKIKHKENLHNSMSLRAPRNSTCAEEVTTECNGNGCSDRDMEKSKSTSYNTFDKDKSENITDSNQASSNLENSSALRDFFTILALSTHSVFEGLAVGLENSTKDVWTLFAGIASHKFFVVFCVCMELQQSDTPRTLFLSYLTVFSWITPVGTAIGTIISETGGSSGDEVAIACLQGIAGGTLLYVVMFEVLNRERTKNVAGLVQLAGILVGFASMLMIEIFAHHEHEHGDPEGEEKTFAFITGNMSTASLVLPGSV